MRKPVCKKRGGEGVRGANRGKVPAASSKVPGRCVVARAPTPSRQVVSYLLFAMAGASAWEATRREAEGGLATTQWQAARFIEKAHPIYIFVGNIRL